MEQSCREPEKPRQKLKLRAGNVEAQRGRGRKVVFYYIRNKRKKKTKRQSCRIDTQLETGGMNDDRLRQVRMRQGKIPKQAEEERPAT